MKKETTMPPFTHGLDVTGPFPTPDGSWLWSNNHTGQLGLGAADSTPWSWLSLDESRKLLKELRPYIYAKLGHPLPSTAAPAARTTVAERPKAAPLPTARVEWGEDVEAHEITAPWYLKNGADRALYWVRLTLKVAPSVRWFSDQRPAAVNGCTANAREIWLNAARCKSEGDAVYLVLHEARHVRQLADGQQMPAGLASVKAWNEHQMEREAEEYARQACTRLGMNSRFEGART